MNVMRAQLGPFAFGSRRDTAANLSGHDHPPTGGLSRSLTRCTKAERA